MKPSIDRTRLLPSTVSLQPIDQEDQENEFCTESGTIKRVQTTAENNFDLSGYATESSSESIDLCNTEWSSAQLVQQLKHSFQGSNLKGIKGKVRFKRGSLLETKTIQCSNQQNEKIIRSHHGCSAGIEIWVSFLTKI